MTLVECGFFISQQEEQVPLQKHLDIAYKNFKEFIAARKITCSQRPFQEKMDT